MAPATLAICSRWSGGTWPSSRPSTLARVDFTIFPEGGWRLEASATPVFPWRAPWRRSRACWRGCGRRAWRSTNGPQPGFLGQGAPDPGAPPCRWRSLRWQGKPSSRRDWMTTWRCGEVAAVLGQLFDAEACSYLITGASPQDALWLDRRAWARWKSVN